MPFPIQNILYMYLIYHHSNTRQRIQATNSIIQTM